MLDPAGRPLTGRLQALLDDPAQASSAHLGLLAVADPAGLDHAQLAEAALHSAETRTHLKGACDALQALSTAALTPQQHDRLDSVEVTTMEESAWPASRPVRFDARELHASADRRAHQCRWFPRRSQTGALACAVRPGCDHPETALLVMVPAALLLLATTGFSERLAETVET